MNLDFEKLPPWVVKQFEMAMGVAVDLAEEYDGSSFPLSLVHTRDGGFVPIYGSRHPDHESFEAEVLRVSRMIHKVVPVNLIIAVAPSTVSYIEKAEPLAPKTAAVLSGTCGYITVGTTVPIIFSVSHLIHDRHYPEGFTVVDERATFAMTHHPNTKTISDEAQRITSIFRLLYPLPDSNV